MPDEMDFIQEQEFAFRHDALDRQLAQGRVRFEPVMRNGIACCHDCAQPLEPHRVAAGICVHCKTKRERQGGFGHPALPPHKPIHGQKKGYARR